MEELTEEQIQEFKEAFSLFDTKNTGTIETKELGQVLRCLGVHTSEEEKRNYIDKYDPNAQGIIYFNDFLEIVNSKIIESKPEEEMREALKLFRFNHHLDCDLLKDEYEKHGDAISSSEIKDIIDFLKFEENGESLLDIDVIVEKIMKKVNPHLK
jgi:calmodulin